MTILLAGTSFADLRTYFGTATSTNTNGLSVSVCVEGITIDATSYYAYLPQWTATESGFFKIRYNSNAGAFRNGVSLLELLDSSDVAVLRLFSTGTTTAVLQYNNGAWTTVGAGAWNYLLAFTEAGIKNLVIEWNHGVTGVLGFYVDGIEIVRVTGDFSALPDIASARINRFTSSNADFFSEWIASSDNNIAYRYYLKPPNAAGALTAWAGSYVDVDETGVNTADYISSTAADQKITFKAAARTFASPVEIKAVVLSMYGRKGSSGPTQVTPIFRIGGVDYETTTKALGFGYKGFQTITETNPATGVAFTRSEANDVNLEFGFKSVA